jgi:hypothetical protein
LYGRQRKELKRGFAPLEKILPLPLLGEGDKGPPAIVLACRSRTVGRP